MPMPMPNLSSAVSPLKVTPLMPLLSMISIPSSLPKMIRLGKMGFSWFQKTTKILREISFMEFGNLVKEENEVTEEVLVKDVLYACQGIDGKKLCELGWLFRKVKGYISQSMGGFPAEDVGTVGLAFCTALQDELSEYYKLLAVLEAQSMNPIPLVSENASSGNYLFLMRLSVWFAEPMVKMRLMAVLVDKCKALRGGAMAGAIHLHAQHGDPLVHDFMRRLLRRVCFPLFEMVRSWVLEGELEDIFAEFFIVGQPVKAESLWREGYQLHAGMLPMFISQSIAQRILRTGKSINFLSVCCDDRGWAEAATEAVAAAGVTTRRGDLGYGETDALESLVMEAAKRIDKHLLDVIYKSYGLLESAIRSSNAQYDGPDILDRLRVKMMPHGIGDCGWDVFSLEYDARVPLDTVFTESVMISLGGVVVQFSNEMEVAKDLDDLLAAHEKYLHSIVEKSLPGERSQTLYKSLFVLFDLILQFRSHADQLYERIHEIQARTVESSSNSRDKNKPRQTKDKSSEPGSWISEGRKALTQRAIEFLQNMGQDLDALATEYKSLLEDFLAL
ncbi:Gamma-tubulin complex component 3 [Hibiscus syriacus]|uniref:Gamma-tubulin complex component 3 n=1 Tax=Hibiscus syriacus TaxID=106335 RepID=A0A6A2XFP5_HIBSY|nr:Gamma-tubulin complex component 3 [Hibiscus syriacus]